MIDSFPSTAHTELENAARLAPWALAAYRRDTEAVRGELGWSAIDSFHAGESRGLVAHLLSCTVISIAGTEDLGDWRDNLDCEGYSLGRFASDHDIEVPTPARQLVLHTGFLQAAHRVMLRIRQMFPRIDATGPLWITGHSLGGAVAQLLPLVWPALRPAGIVSYGAPRVLHRSNRSAWPAAGFGSRVTRCVAIDDLVPQVPFGFGHPPSELKILRGYAQVRDELSWLDRLWRGLRRLRYLRRPITGSRLAHAMTLYREWLELMQ